MWETHKADSVLTNKLWLDDYIDKLYGTFIPLGAGSKSEALQLGVQLILLYFIRIPLLGFHLCIYINIVINTEKILVGLILSSTWKKFRLFSKSQCYDDFLKKSSST